MKEYTNKTVIESLDLPLMESFEDLVRYLRLSERLVFWLVSSDSNRYTVFRIPKSSGDFRIIHSPVYSLKTVQRWILDNILYKIRISPFSFGFCVDGKGSPLVRVAEKHKNNLYVLKIDIKDFYPSISRQKVYNQFVNIGYNSCIASLLTSLCITDDCLPQGAVTSAYLANIVCRNLDYRIAGYCNRRDIVYTRYADDLTFSCDNRDALKKVHGMVKKILLSEGFSINSKKTMFLSPKVQKRVLGITINDNSIKAPKELKRLVRSMVYNSFLTKDYSCNDRIKGYIAYIDSIEPNYISKIKKYIKSLYSSEYTLFNEIVDAFNKNKFYADLPEMKTHCFSDLCEGEGCNEEEWISAIYANYQCFLTSHGIVADVICESTPDDPF